MSDPFRMISCGRTDLPDVLRAHRPVRCQTGSSAKDVGLRYALCARRAKASVLCRARPARAGVDAWLAEGFPIGRSTPVRSKTMELFHKLTREMIEPVQPAIVEYQVHIRDGHEFKVGHRICPGYQQHGYSHRNRRDDQCRISALSRVASSRAVTHKVYRDGTYPSHLPAGYSEVMTETRSGRAGRRGPRRQRTSRSAG